MNETFAQIFAQRRYEQAKDNVAALQEKLRKSIELEEFDAARLIAQDLTRALAAANHAANRFADQC